METVLVTAIGSFSADIVIKTLKHRGLTVIGCDIFPKQWVVDAYNVDQFVQVPRATEGERYRDVIFDICLENKVDYVIPLTDVEVDELNKYREWFSHHGILLCISPEKSINICRSKLSTYQSLLNAGFESALIPTICGINACSVEKTWFPLICKPSNGRSSQGIRRVYNYQELQMFLRSESIEDYIIQPIIEGPIVTVDIVRSAAGKEIVSMPRKELLRTLNGAGTSVLVFHDSDLNNLCKDIANALNVVGCVNFEFIVTEEGKYYFVECNPRFSGGIEFSCMAGYDFVWNHLNCFTNTKLDPLEPYQDCYIARKYEEYITEICEEKAEF